MRTRLTDLLQVEHPVMLAGMGGVSYHRVVAAVSEAGGFGCLGASTMAHERMIEEIELVNGLTRKPYGVDLLTAAPGDMSKKVQDIIDGGARVFVAGGVWMGTRFIATPEAQAVPGYKQALLDIGEDGTVVTRAYTGKTCRVVRNEYTQYWDEHTNELQPFPQQVLRSMTDGANHL